MRNPNCCYRLSVPRISWDSAGHLGRLISRKSKINNGLWEMNAFGVGIEKVDVDHFAIGSVTVNFVPVPLADSTSM